jgi:hypothetical protein
MPSIVLPKLHESLMNEEWYKQHLDAQAKRAYNNPFCMAFLKTGMKEGILSDMAGALGRIHDTVVEAAKPNLISRQIIDVRTTTETLERFPRAKKSVAYVASESGTLRIHGERYDTVDISTNVIIKDGIEWTREFAEDAKWNVLNRQLEELGRSVAEKETERVLNLYNAITAADLAGGAKQGGLNADFSWNKLVQVWNAIEGEDFHPDTMFMRPLQVSELFTATEFINSQYLPSTELEMTRGLIGQALTMRLYKSSLVPQDTGQTGYNQVFAADKSIAAVMLVRRDLTTETYEDPKNGIYGIVASERIGLGVLRSKGVAIMNNLPHAWT